MQRKQYNYLLTLIFLPLLIIIRIPLLQHDLFTNIGEVNYLKEQPTIAYQWLSTAHEIIPTRLSSRLGLSRLYLQQNQPEKAVRLLDYGDTHTPISDLILGHALLNRGQMDTAISKWNRAGVTNAYFISLGLQSDSHFWFNLAAELDPSSHTYYQLARAYKAQSNDNKSADAYQTALSIDSNWSSDYERFAAQYQLSLFLYASRGQYREDARHHLLLALDMAIANYPSVLPALYLRLGTIAMENKRYTTAINYYEELATISPSEGNYILLGNAVYSLEKNIASATPFFVQAVELSDSPPDSIKKIAAIITRQGGNNFDMHLDFFCSHLDEELAFFCLHS